MWWRYIRLLFLVIVMVGCAKNVPNSSTATVKEYDESTHHIELKAGESFAIVLSSNPTTGYQWAVTLPPNQMVVRLINTEYKPDKYDRPRMGSGGKENFRFTALNPGKVDIVFNYSRSWEIGKPAAQQKVFHIFVVK